MTESKNPTPARCYGVCCPRHSTCKAYHAVNGAINAPRPVGTCDETRKVWPGYVPIVEAAK